MQHLDRECIPVQRLESYIKKTEKAKKGGMCPGFVGRDPRTGKDYLFKRPLNAPREGNWRVWDEILAAKLFSHAGILVPEMFAAQDRDGFLYVASALLPGIRNCKREDFQRLPAVSKEPIFCSVLMHTWLGNRDLVNVHGENFVMDRDKRVFYVDLGAMLCSGFRSHGFQIEDRVNVTGDTILPFFLDRDNPEFGRLMDKSGRNKHALNIDQIKAFFGNDYFANQQAYHVQGALLIQKFSDQDIENIVNSTGHTEAAKKFRINMLKQRRDALITMIQDKYNNPNLLEEEKTAQILQRILHRAGVFKPQTQWNDGADAQVSYRANFLNAVKPRIGFVVNDLMSIEGYPIEDLLTILGFPRPQRSDQVNPIQLFGRSQVCNVIYSRFITETLQACFYSLGCYREVSGRLDVFKGAGKKGYLPSLSVEQGIIFVTLPIVDNVENIYKHVQSIFSLHDDNGIILDRSIPGCPRLRISINLAEFAWRLMADVSVRKTAIVSENQNGQILAGRLDPHKKAVTGFATAGGNAEYPYHAKRSAREEGIEEFGYDISSEEPLLTIGSTLTNQKANIFLAPAGETAPEPTHEIQYQEFQNGSVRYYHFHELASECRRSNGKFDRSSADLYLRYYQENIQRVLNEILGDDAEILVHISKKPQSLGHIILKPSLNTLGTELILANRRCVNLIAYLFSRQCYLENRVTQQGSYTRSRQCIVLDPTVNPRDFYIKLCDAQANLTQLTDIMNSNNRLDLMPNPNNRLGASFTWIPSYSTLVLMLIGATALILLVMSIVITNFVLPLPVQYGLGAGALASLGVFVAPKVQRFLCSSASQEMPGNPARSPHQNLINDSQNAPY